MYIANLESMEKDLKKYKPLTSIMGSQLSSIQSMAKNYKAAIRPLMDNKPNWLSQSQEIQKSIDSMLKPLELSKMHSVTSTAKMLGLTSMMESNQKIFKTFDRNSIWGNQLKHVDIQSQLINLISTSNDNLLEKMMISMQSQPVAVLNTALD